MYNLQIIPSPVSINQFVLHPNHRQTTLPVHNPIAHAASRAIMRMMSTRTEERERLTAVPLNEKEASQSPEEVRRTVLTSIKVCAFYICVSSSMVFVNKALSHSFHFRMMNALLLLQMMFTIVLLRIARDVLHLIDFPDLEPKRARQVAPVSLFYSLNAAVALVALRELSIPSYTMVKRLAPLFTIALETVLLRRRPTSSIVFALSIMAIGTLLAAKSDTSSSTSAWLLGFSSCLFQATYLTFVKRSGIDTGLSSFGILYYHSILSLPFIFVIATAVGEMTPLLAYEHWMNPAFLIVFVFSLFMGLTLNYALFLCTEKTSPTSTVVSGQVKAMGQTAVGIFVFGGVDLNPRYLLGTIVNISGGIMYAYAKFKALQNR